MTTPSRPHATDGSPCWCKPRVAVLCTQCNDDPACRTCGGSGLVDAPDGPDAAAIVIHNDPEEA